MSGTVDAIICVGCLVKGDTMHFEYIAQTVATGLMSVQLQTSVPRQRGDLFQSFFLRESLGCGCAVSYAL